MKQVTQSALQAALETALFTRKPTSRPVLWYTRALNGGNTIDVVVAPNPAKTDAIHNVVVRVEDPRARIGETVKWTATFDGSAPFETVKAAVYATLES
jgi:hypothetical protein